LDVLILSLSIYLYQARYEEVLQQKAALQKRLQAARGAGVTAGTPPPTGGPASAKASGETNYCVG
jgi:hypothetical protein